MNKEESIKSALNAYKDNKFYCEQFMKRIVNFFSDNPKLNQGALPIIHSIKYRTKDIEHLKDKIERKWDKIGPIDSDNLFEKITDLTGVRILHLYQSQFPEIHKEILTQVEENEWYLCEAPKAYTWDPEAKKFYERLQINCEIKDSFYTSIHYLLKPRKDSNIKCEIQVRTLFEEIWGEIDHFINYPYSTDSIACKEQLRVLSKLTSTGTRLADSIFSSYEEFKQLVKKINNTEGSGKKYAAISNSSLEVDK